MSSCQNLRLRTAATVALIVLSSTAAVAHVVRAARAEPQLASDPTASFEGLLPYLPERCVLGYVTNRLPTLQFAKAFGDRAREDALARASRAYLLAQHAVAPRWFLPMFAGMRPELEARYGPLTLTVGNFDRRDEEVDRQIAEHRDAEVYRDADARVFLWRMR